MRILDIHAQIALTGKGADEYFCVAVMSLLTLSSFNFISLNMVSIVALCLLILLSQELPRFLSILIALATSCAVSYFLGCLDLFDCLLEKYFLKSLVGIR